MPSTLPEFNSPAHSSSRSLPSQPLDSSREFSGQLPHRGRASSNSEYSIHYDISRTPPREASSSKTSSAYDSSDRPSSRRRNSQSDTPAEVPTAAPVAPKYECSHCGKGFNRPSSLKVRCSLFLRCKCLNLSPLIPRYTSIATRGKNVRVLIYKFRESIDSRLTLFQLSYVRSKAAAGVSVC